MDWPQFESAAIYFINIYNPSDLILLNELASTLLKNSSNPTSLTAATEWSKRSIEIINKSTHPAAT